MEDTDPNVPQPPEEDTLPYSVGVQGADKPDGSVTAPGFAPTMVVDLPPPAESAHHTENPLTLARGTGVGAGVAAAAAAAAAVSSHQQLLLYTRLHPHCQQLYRTGRYLLATSAAGMLLSFSYLSSLFGVVMGVLLLRSMRHSARDGVVSHVLSRRRECGCKPGATPGMALTLAVYAALELTGFIVALVLFGGNLTNPYRPRPVSRTGRQWGSPALDIWALTYLLAAIVADISHLVTAVRLLRQWSALMRTGRAAVKEAAAAAAAAAASVSRGGGGRGGRTGTGAADTEGGWGWYMAPDDDDPTGVLVLVEAIHPPVSAVTVTATATATAPATAPVTSRQPAAASNAAAVTVAVGLAARLQQLADTMHLEADAAEPEPEPEPEPV